MNKYIKTAALGSKLSTALEARRSRAFDALRTAGIEAATISKAAVAVQKSLPESATLLILGDLRILISYETVVAFSTKSRVVATLRNLYSRTTDKSIDGFIAERVKAGEPVERQNTEVFVNALKSSIAAELAR